MRSERSADRLQRDSTATGTARHPRRMNRTIGWRFAVATHHAPAMSLDQFIAARADAFRQRNADTFRGLDWNADGKLTLADSWRRSGRVHVLDRDGVGYVLVRERAERRQLAGRRAAFCADNEPTWTGK